MKKYEVRIDDGILKAKLQGRHNIWMYRAPRGKPIEEKPGVYILADERGYCCYVGETDDLKRRIATHDTQDRFCWWSHTIYFWDESTSDDSNAFFIINFRHWYEKSLKEAVESKHPTFTKSVRSQPREPDCGADVLNEILDLLNVIGFESSEPIPPPTPPPPPPPSGREEPIPHKNHHPPLGVWPTYTALAKAIADKNGKPGTAGGIQQKLTNFWVPSRRRYAKANAATRQKLESVGIIFDEEGFVTSCANVPYPLS